MIPTVRGPDAVHEDRASYYGADGLLRAADSRSLGSPGRFFGFYRTVFEEYRYDALGRRVWVRARRWCENDPEQFSAACRIGKIRRIVWDGSQELYEIQMPGGDGSAYLENDTRPIQPPSDANDSDRVDPNPYFGRVAYTHGLALDQPLSVIRMGYGDLFDNDGTLRTYRALAPFAITPLWTWNGQADLGIFADGGVRKCETVSGYLRCVYIGWPAHFYAYARHYLRRSAWHGSLVEDKRDATGTFYRRNRVYDPATGRFTQEDPIGLAGGRNLYGFANGDPISLPRPPGKGRCRRSRRNELRRTPCARRIREVSDHLGRDAVASLLAPERIARSEAARGVRLSAPTRSVGARCESMSS